MNDKKWSDNKQMTGVKRITETRRLGWLFLTDDGDVTQLVTVTGDGDHYDLGFDQKSKKCQETRRVGVVVVNWCGIGLLCVRLVYLVPGSE